MGTSAVSALLALDEPESTRNNKRVTTRNQSASLGFDVSRDGFSFSNWSGLTADDALTFANMAKLFSKSATCVEDPLDATCTLRSGQRINLSAINAFLAQGRCEGMTVLAARLFLYPKEIKKLDPTANNTINLTPKASAREIAYYSVTQVLPEIQGFTARTIMKQPYVIAQEIAFRIKLKRPVSLGVYGPNFAHSVMPFAVKISPRETIFSVYDPNFPNQIRTLKLNNIRGEWIYDSAVYPDGSYGSLTWKGPGRLDYVPIDLRFASSGS
ncbi:MAG: hypothetical protein RL729_1429 [Actinomycetota bacterium]|jgi:hypothetical protein